MTNLINYSESDINRDFARNAFYGTSHSPERRGDDAIKGYVNEMQVVEAKFAQWMTEENEAELKADLEAYRKGYLTKYTAYLAAHSRVISVLVTGPANFPTRRNQKRNETCDRRAKEYLDWNDATLKRLERKYNPVVKANAPISSGDDNAVEKLQAKIAQAEAAQEMMKKANALIRKLKKVNEQPAVIVSELMNLGFSAETGWGLLKPDYMGRWEGFPRFALTNNNANIRRMKERIAELEREEKRREVTQDSQEREVNGVKVVENTDINRIQLIFPGKPASGIISQLKSNGFHWSPREKAWQRLLNDNARYAVERILNSL